MLTAAHHCLRQGQRLFRQKINHRLHGTARACALLSQMLKNVRLTSRTLPGAEQIRLLADQYFMNIHPLRCFAFVHKPSFLQNLETENVPRERNALIHIICALGAQ
jgi:hypothetical protein